MEKTLVLAKPDALQRGLVGEIISRFERKGLKLVAIKMLETGDELLDAHYAEHADKPFFNDLKKFMKSSPIVAMVWEGAGSIETVRLMVGATNARKAVPGTIRGDFGMSGASNNMVHASDSPESAKKEVGHFFSSDEVFDYTKSEYEHVYAPEEL